MRESENRPWFSCPKTQPWFLLFPASTSKHNPTPRLLHNQRQGSPQHTITLNQDHHHPILLVSWNRPLEPRKRAKPSLKHPIQPRGSRMTHKTSRVPDQTTSKCEQACPIRKRLSQIPRETEKRVTNQKNAWGFLASQEENRIIGDAWASVKANCKFSPLPSRSRGVHRSQDHKHSFHLANLSSNRGCVYQTLLQGDE